MAWDKNTPLGSEAANTADDYFRNTKALIEQALQADTTEGLEAIFPGSDTANPVYRYRGLKGTTGSQPVSGQYGLYTNTTRGVVQRDNGSTWEDIATLIPAGSVMVFYQAAAPVGWTKVVTQNDKALRVVSGLTGGTAGGTLAFSTDLAHTHTVTSHSHTISSDTTGATLDNRTSVTAGSGTFAGNTRFMDDIGTALYSKAGQEHHHTHDHGGTGAAAPGTDSKLGALAYIDIILCSKD